MKTAITLAFATMVILVAGCTQHSLVEVRYPGPLAQESQSGARTFRTDEIDGAHVTLTESTFEKDGKRVICRQYVDSVKRDVDQPEPKTTIDVAYECTIRLI